MIPKFSSGGLKVWFYRTGGMYGTNKQQVAVALSESSGYEYDAEGNQIKVTHSDYSKTAVSGLAYDHENMLIAHTKDAAVVTMSYNPDNERTLKSASDEDTKYLLDNGAILEEEYRDGNTKRFFRDIGSSLGGNILSYDTKTGKKVWYHYDRMGRVVAQTDENGNIYGEEGLKQAYGA